MSYVSLSVQCSNFPKYMKFSVDGISPPDSVWESAVSGK